MSKRPLKSATAGVDNESKIELIRLQSYFISILSVRTIGWISRCKSHLQVRKLLKFSLMEKIFPFIHFRL